MGASTKKLSTWEREQVNTIDKGQMACPMKNRTDNDTKQGKGIDSHTTTCYSQKSWDNIAGTLIKKHLHT